MLALVYNALLTVEEAEEEEEVLFLTT